jgi:hypothetical protein
MSPSRNSPATEKGAGGQAAVWTALANDTYGFDPRTARRVAFVRWLVATGRLSDWDRAAPAGAADPGVAATAPRRV